LSKIGQTTDLIIAAGDAVDVAAQIRKTAVAGGNHYAVSGSVFAAAKIEPPSQDIVTVACGRDDENVSVTSWTRSNCLRIACRCRTGFNKQRRS
jgi:hypothetical protein